MPSTQSITRGYTLAFISAIILSTTGVLIRHLTQTYHIPALVLAFWRAVFVVITLLLVLGLFQPKLLQVPPRLIPQLIFHGLVLSLFNSLWTLSVSLNGAAVATVLAYSSAAFTALLGWWLLKESLTWVKMLAVIFSLGGCMLVSGATDPAVWNANLLGILTGVFSGLGYAGYSLMGRKASQQGLNPWSTLIYSFIFAALFLLAYNLFSGGHIPGTAATPAELLWLGNEWAGWGWLLLLAAVPTVAGFGLYNVSLVHLPSSIANLIVTTEPIFTAVIAYFLLDEQLTVIQISGSLLILLGVFFLRIYEGRLAAKVPRMLPIE